MSKRVDGWPVARDARRVRVIIDNDLSGDPDGLVALAHHLLSPTVDIRGIIGTHLRPGDPWADGQDDVPAEAVRAARKVLRLCHRDDVPVVAGAGPQLSDHASPIESEGARLIVDEAMRDDVDTPLFIACGASLTEVASAWLLEPRIAQRLTVVWIGGHEHAWAQVAPGAPDLEYNLAIDPTAGQVVFNLSDLPLWQIPRDAYRQTLATRAELEHRMAGAGRLGRWLFERLGRVASSVAGEGAIARETYVLGDSPLVMATALQSMFESDTSSSAWVDVPCPFIDDSGLYVANPVGRTIRVFTRLDNRLWLEDLYAKLALHARR